MSEKMPEAIDVGYFYHPAPMSEYCYHVIDKDIKMIPELQSKYIRSDKYTALLEVARGMAGALESAREELYDCHSHCDPETSNNSHAVAYRDCKKSLTAFHELINETPSKNNGRDG